MLEKVTGYFDNTIMPIIRNHHSEVLPYMSIMILGSVGLGIDDEYSDLEAAIYLDDPIWKKLGGQLQLSLNDCLFETNPWKREGSVISVYPLSWLLDGQAKKFLASANNLPWEDVSFETLFNIQENPIIYDPQGTLTRLRAATSPLQRPEYLWKKSLILGLQRLVGDFLELKKSVIRNLLTEAYIQFGCVIEGLCHIGFLINHKYYPYRKNLRWAFNRLHLPTSDFHDNMDLILFSSDWGKKIEIIDTMITIYKAYISENSLIPEIDIWSADLDNEFVWAERLKAWESPNWRDWITNCTNKALENDYASYQFWVWNLWGWANCDPNKNEDNKEESSC